MNWRKNKGWGGGKQERGEIQRGMKEMVRQSECWGELRSPLDSAHVVFDQSSSRFKGGVL